MMEWFSANLATIIAGAAVLGLVALCLRNLLPRKGKPASCAGCSGCSGACSGCAQHKSQYK